MNPSFTRLRAEEALTLPELLVLIVLALVILAMLFPFIEARPTSITAPRRRSDADLRVIVHAIEQYNVEYGQYPRLGFASGAPIKEDEFAGEPAAGMTIHNAALFNTLRDLDRAPNLRHVQNPRNQVFVEAKIAADKRNPKGGFLDDAGSTGVGGSWYDPWGSEYNIAIDSNGDGVIDVGRFYEDFKGANAPKVTAGAFTLGKDKKLGREGDRKYKNGDNYADDLVSWNSR